MTIDIQRLNSESKTAALSKLDQYPGLTLSLYNAASEGKTWITYTTDNMEDTQELISLAQAAGFVSFITGDHTQAYIGWGRELNE